MILQQTWIVRMIDWKILRWKIGLRIQSILVLMIGQKNLLMIGKKIVQMNNLHWILLQRIAEMILLMTGWKIRQTKGVIVQRKRERMILLMIRLMKCLHRILQMTPQRKRNSP